MVVNIEKLFQELTAAGLPVGGIAGTAKKISAETPVIYVSDQDIRIDLSEKLTPDQEKTLEEILAAHDPVDAQKEVEESSITAAKSIPGWATWDEAKALDYIESEVIDLKSAKVVLAAMARLLIALRNKQWPDLQE